ncbi:hypothetical protein [Marinobacter zhanjiangensis]|uniref:Uncharacterized protein n=1 Tax=Marinobacter zhanjiangensis TaxID=578215 RepID=A0ABQ3B4K4_9GAMM|nr:hypothetical protein [Marinobacter zhanjiangensis]GGY73318.1 hypothetical protein GCM10007071_20570 [Marinobacter zhanjiangensis]
MNSATLRPRPAKDPTAFFDDLVQTVKARREALTKTPNLSEGERPLTRLELIEWLQFRYWYLQEEGRFVDSWLSNAPGTELLAGLGALMADSDRQSRHLLAQLEALGTTTATWSPESEWDHWISEFHASLDDIPERIMAYAVAQAPVPMETVEQLLPEISATPARSSARDRWPMALGLSAAKTYATTLERQAHTRARVMHAFELEQKARLAFGRRIRSLRARAAANDVVDEGSASGEGNH